VVIVSGSTFYLSEVTKFELLTTIVEYNCVYFSPTLRINVFILNTVLSARYLDITPLVLLRLSDLRLSEHGRTTVE